MLLGLSAIGGQAMGQTVERAGRGSYASTPPAYKAQTSEHGGCQSSKMLTRKIYCDEQAGRPLPTNDWWTDLINNRYSGALWSYPAMLSTGERGVTVAWPSYWADAGKEMKSKSRVTVGGRNFSADAAIATDWHDLDVSFRMPSTDGTKEMQVTMAHGSPFTWFTFDGITPEISADGAAAPFGYNSAKGRCGLKVGDDLYGLYFPEGATVESREGSWIINGADWLVVALLTEESQLSSYAGYAESRITDSRVTWAYDGTGGKVTTCWNITAENLRRPGETGNVLLGFLPHLYKYSSVFPTSSGISYQTPRGEMKMYSSADGRFEFAVPFTGMLPYYAAPDEAADASYDRTILSELTERYASEGAFGADTYWGGKGLTQMALNMTFAKETGDEETYQLSRRRLREALVDWLTYTPGEEDFFFSYYPRWGGMLGFNVSYDSDAFNDHHFHYGYFTYAAALLCLEDKEFARDYGELLTMIAKDYANYDRSDSRFPFLRTLDPWCGHSWAGGLGDAGNDNGNGQESTSEAMQGWGGLYLLGVALGDTEMRDAGIWGWSTEARATREYWFDVDAPRQANAGGRKTWAGKGSRIGNYDYSQYPYAYNSNITGKGIGWWTWFGGDPLFMHGIQWMPVSPALQYLSWDTDFTDWAYDDMMSGANSTFSHEWFAETFNKDNGESIQPLADNDWGSVTLTYMQRSRPEEASQIFDRAYAENRHLAKSVSTSHISYYLIHNHLTYGDIDFSVHADMPTASCHVKNGVRSYTVYNPDDAERTVRFYRDGALLRTVKAPAGKMTVFTAEAKASGIELTSPDGNILPPGTTARLSAKVVDQYGATWTQSAPVTFKSSTSGVVIDASGNMRIAASLAKGSKFTVEASDGQLTASLSFEVNDRPKINSAEITGLPEIIEAGATVNVALLTSDQYGTVNEDTEAVWTLTGKAGAETVEKELTVTSPGRYTLKAVAGETATEQEVVVLPRLPEISLKAKAISSSEENIGSVTSNANDGNAATRWGSAHSDNEWLVLDFGEEAYIAAADINWEAAFGADYDFEVAQDGCARTTHKGNYASGSQTVTVPAESAWVKAASVRGNNSSGHVETPIGVSGRYLRMKGVRRGSAYGYSLYEIAVRGLAASTPESSFVGIDFGLPEVMDQNQSMTLTPKAYTRRGEEKSVSVTWSADKKALFNGNVFTPQEYGTYTLSATSAGGLEAAGSLFVNETVRLASVAITPALTSAIIGQNVKLSVEAFDQFGGVYPLDTEGLKIAVIDVATGLQASPSKASYDVASGIFTASQKGEYKVIAGEAAAEATVKVVDVSEANLALGKPATASGSQGGNTASNINDGNSATRWESPAEDNHRVIIDLQEPFLVNRMKLVWEGAYADRYGILVSLDGDSWWNIHDCQQGKGGTETISFEAVPARYVRLDCLHRATEWGSSLFEWEVYGTDRFSSVDDGKDPVISECSVNLGNGDVEIVLTAEDDSQCIFGKATLIYPWGQTVESKTVRMSSGKAETILFDGLKDNLEYLVKVEVQDPWGNTATTEKRFLSSLDITGRNIALDCPVEVSSRENGALGGEKAVDGDMSTRWGSDFADGETITIDLEDIYSLTEIVIYWDGTAYATDYEVETSCDGVEWQPLFSRQSWSGAADGNGCRPDHYQTVVKTYARYVRLKGLRRATVYGTSIREFEVYAENDFTMTGVASVGRDVSSGQSVDLSGIRHKEMPAKGIVILDGRKVMRPGR